MSEGKDRVFWADFARTVAICLVILCHVSEAVLNVNVAQYYLNRDAYNKVLSLLGFMLGRQGVPIFLFLTGNFLLNRQMDTKDAILKFYNRNLRSLVITIWAWLFLMFPYLSSVLEEFDVKALIKCMLFWDKVPYTQMWYLPFIVGIYIGIPFLAVIVRNISTSIIACIWFLLVFIKMVVPTASTYLDIGNPALETSLIAGGGYAAIYLTLGYYLGKNKEAVSKIPPWLLAFVYVFFTAAACWLQDYTFRLHLNLKFGYDNILLFISAVPLYCLLQRADLYLGVAGVRRARFFECISKISFGMYFIHVPIINELQGIKAMNSLGVMQKMVVLFCATFFLSSVILAPFLKHRKLSKLLLNTK